MRFFLSLLACLFSLHLAAPAALAVEREFAAQAQVHQGKSEATASETASDAADVQGSKTAPKCSDHCHATAQAASAVDVRLSAYPSFAKLRELRPAALILLVPPPQ